MAIYSIFWQKNNITNCNIFNTIQTNMLISFYYFLKGYYEKTKELKS